MRAVPSRAAAPDPAPYAAAEAAFAEAKAYLSSREAQQMSESDLERELQRRGQELMRTLLQGHLDQRSPGEAAGPVAGADGVERSQRRVHERHIETTFGTVAVERVGYARPGDDSLHPLAAALNLPPERYSLEVRRRVAEAAASEAGPERSGSAWSNAKRSRHGASGPWKRNGWSAGDASGEATGRRGRRRGRPALQSHFGRAVRRSGLACGRGSRAHRAATQPPGRARVPGPPPGPRRRCRLAAQHRRHPQAAPAASARHRPRGGPPPARRRPRHRASEQTRERLTKAERETKLRYKQAYAAWSFEDGGLVSWSSSPAFIDEKRR